MLKSLRNNLVPIVLTLLISSCGEGPLLSDASEDRVVLQFPQGGFYARESIIPLRVFERGRSISSWTDFDARLTDLSGRILRTWRGLYSEGPDFSLEIPEDLENIRQGELLELTISVYDRRLLLSEGKLQFFLVDVLPPLSGTTHPMIVYPGSRVLMDLLGSEPWKGKTWVRWSWDDKIIREGLWTSTSQFRWDTPRSKDGAYALKAEIFPQAPARGTYSFASPLVLNFPVAASALDPEDYGPRELKPDSSYFFLYHFRGNLRDTGTEGDPAMLPEWNGLDIGLDQGLFGVKFQPGNGLTRNGSPFPQNKNGEVQAFSLTVSGVLSKDPDGSVYKLASPNGSFILELVQEKGEWILSYTVGDWKGSFRKPSVPLEIFSQTFSYIPGAQGAEILWFHGPELMGFSQTIQTEPLVVPPGGVLEIGGEKGFRGILDEFGLYYKDSTNRPSADGRLLERHLQSMATGSLVWAAGFDGSYLDGGFTASEGMIRKRGQAVLPQGQWLDTPEMEDLSAGFQLTLPGKAPGNYRISLIDTQGKVTESLLDSSQWDLSEGEDPPETHQLVVVFGDKPPGAVEKILTRYIPRPEYTFKLRVEALTGPDAELDYIICEKLAPAQEDLSSLTETPLQP